MLCVGCRDVFLPPFYFCFLLSPRVIISTYTNHFIIIEILISCFFYGPKKIFMAMNKHWQLFSYFSLWFLFPVNIFVCSPGIFRLRIGLYLYIFTKFKDKIRGYFWGAAGGEKGAKTCVNMSVARPWWQNLP